MASENNILQKIEALKSEYYNTNSKNILFKNSQKFDCAESIVQNIDLTKLFQTIIQIQGNQMHFNYNVFKTVIHPSIYMDFINYIFQINEQILQVCSTYDVIVDFKGLTMTGVERYKDFVSLLSDQGKLNGKNFLQKLNCVYITNPPFMVASIGKILLPLMDKIVKDKIVIVS
jgi:hypothetical protein